MYENQNPIDWLMEKGWTEKEASNLLSMLYAESKERLWEILPRWISHVGEIKGYTTNILDLVALGILEVTANESNEWLFSVNEDFKNSPEGLQMAEELFPGGTH